MSRMHRTTLSAATTLFVALAAACSDNGPTNVSQDFNARSAPGSAPRFATIPSPSQVIIQGSDLGQFVGPFVADRSGRALTEFWDNSSADEDGSLTPPAYRCNIGLFASGNFSTNCQNEAAGSAANAGGYDTYWADGPELRDPSSFMFSGAYSYKVTLKGSFARVSSTVGFYTRDILGYHYNALADFSAKVINSSTVISTGGADWGMFITNAYNPDLMGCDVNMPGPYACSDATGGFTSQLYQQFVLFMNPAQTSYLVGFEDSELEVGGVPDSDYNDYIVAVAPIAPDMLGCSPGYWKNHNFPAGYSKSQLFRNTSFGGGATFDNAFGNMTLQDVLSNGGGGLNALGRQTVSAFFNAITLSSFDMTPQQVIDAFNGVYPGSDASYNVLKNRLEALTDVDGRVCPNPTGR